MLIFEMSSFEGFDAQSPEIDGYRSRSASGINLDPSSNGNQQLILNNIVSPK
jgi:hypothetical protein